MPTSLSEQLGFDPIPSCVEAFKNGEFIIVVDSTSRENEGDLIIAAEDMTPEKMAFMVRFSSGIICTPLTPALSEHFSLPPMIPPNSNEDPNGTAYTVTIDGSGPLITTGISASDRSLTCNLLASSDSTATSFRRPGHILPLIAKPGGILERTGHTEAAVEFCRLAGKRPVGVISEIVEEPEIIVETVSNSASTSTSDKGSGPTDRRRSSVTNVTTKLKFTGGTDMMRRDACLKFARRWALKVCTVEDLVEFVEREKKIVGNGSN